MMLLSLEQVTRLYGIVIGVNDVTLTVPEGAHGILGPNGAGKSTLLNLITGQLRPSKGKLTVLGHSPRDPALLRRLGYLPGSEGMYADVSAIEWVTYLTQLQGFRASDARQMACRAMARVQLTDVQDRKISTFSRGMRQRTRLAQAIAHEPELLILDEAFSGLDPIARHAMTTLLQQWIAEGRSLLIASHVLHEIESLTRSFLLISGGRLLASGSTEEISRLLTSVPATVELALNEPRKLAAQLVASGLVDSVRVEADRLHATTGSGRELAQFLADQSVSGALEISEVRSSDDSLQDVFHSLMKLHRGIA
jgi:ABC-2 type transport system ATP-binding protein